MRSGGCELFSPQATPNVCGHSLRQTSIEMEVMRMLESIVELTGVLSFSSSDGADWYLHCRVDYCSLARDQLWEIHSQYQEVKAAIGRSNAADLQKR